MDNNFEDFASSVQFCLECKGEGKFIRAERGRNCYGAEVIVGTIIRDCPKCLGKGWVRIKVEESK